MRGSGKPRPVEPDARRASMAARTPVRSSRWSWTSAVVLFSWARRIRPGYWVRLPLLATGAARKKVSEAGPSKPSLA